MIDSLCSWAVWFEYYLVENSVNLAANWLMLIYTIFVNIENWLDFNDF